MVEMKTCSVTEPAMDVRPTPDDELRLTMRCLLTVLAVWVTAIVFRPFTLVPDWYTYLANLRSAVTLYVDWQTPLHVLVFGVIGLCLGLSIRRGAGKPMVTVLSGLVVLLVLMLELGQAAVESRHAAAGDLVIDVIALLAGFQVARRKFDRLDQLVRDYRSLVIGSAYMLILGSAFTVVLLGHLGSGFQTWDTGYPLVLGNEFSGDRPWTGQLCGVAIYNRSLTVSEIESLAVQPMDSEAGVTLRRKVEAAALYQLGSWESHGDEKICRNLADTDHQSGGALTLMGLSPGISSSCLQFSERGRAVAESFYDVITSVKEHGRFTIELFCDTHDLDQAGPARLVTVSVDPSRRNLTIGQEKNSLVFRVRTPLLGENGVRGGSPSWPGIFTDRNRHHICVTCAKGEVNLYKDGSLAGRPFKLYGVRYVAGIECEQGDYLVWSVIFITLGVVSVSMWPMITLGPIFGRTLISGFLPFLAYCAVLAIIHDRDMPGGIMWFGPAMILSGCSFGVWIRRMTFS